MNQPMSKARLDSKRSLSNLKPSQINLQKMFINGKAEISGGNSTHTQQKPPSTLKENLLDDQSIIEDKVEQP